MDLNNFSDKLKVTIDSAFNYARENELAYFSPIHILIMLLQNDKEVFKTLDYFKINKELILEESIKISKDQNKNPNETKVQSNVILLLKSTNVKIKENKNKNFESNILLMELASESSPATKKILNKFNIYYKNLDQYIKNLIEKAKTTFENIDKLLKHILF